MAIIPIRTWGDPVLKRSAKEITDITDDLRTLSKNMFETMLAADGVGLAGNQVGIAQRIFVIDIPSPSGPPLQYTLLNATITSRSKETEAQEEGCLSFPGIYGPVERSLHVEIQGMDLDGSTITLKGTGLLARAFQHELDHLDGMVFIERMNMVHRVMLNRQLRELAKQTKAALAGRGTAKL